MCIYIYICVEVYIWGLGFRVGLVGNEEMCSVGITWGSYSLIPY